MAKKRVQSGAGRAKQPPPAVGIRVRRWAKKHTGWLWTIAALAGVIGLIVYFSDPFGSYTAVDAGGKTVQTGVIKTAGARPVQGSRAPDFLLADYHGKAVKLDDFRGKTVLLNFWATWCTVCKAEMPDMQQLVRENPNDLVVLAVNQAEGAGAAKAFTDSLGVTRSFHFALDKNEDVTRAYELPSGLPHSFFIDKNGIIRVIENGGMNYDQMKQFLAETRHDATTG